MTASQPEIQGSPDPAKTLMALWMRHKAETRPISDIITEARAGMLPGVQPFKSGFGFAVVDEAAALAGMKRA